MAVAEVTGDYRRGKTALFLIACSWAGAVPHWLGPLRSLLPAITLAVVVGGYALQTVLRARLAGSPAPRRSSVEPLIGEGQPWPALDVVVAARDEEAVVSRLVERLSALNYPTNKLVTWIIDDGSEDRTPVLLDQLKVRFPNLQVIHRPPEAGGGKSGALNTALQQMQGEWLLVLDADAQLDQDVLERMVPFAVQGGWSAVQLRKAVIDAEHNWLTRSQAMEMAFDALIQEGRLVSGGVAELRGNGQLIRRDVLEECGGFNEATVTDDLDLSFRLLIDGALVGILWDPPVEEEAVESLPALWKQRQRWAEGGLQRFFDYWPTLISTRLTLAQRRDLASFFLLQYALPVVSFADFTTSVVSRSMPCYWPLSIVAFSVSGLAYWRGCRRSSEGPAIPSLNVLSMLVAIIYLGHWFVVIPWVSLRMAIFPKSLVWAKTTHGKK